jgi:hypothetical protein
VGSPATGGGCTLHVLARVPSAARPDPPIVGDCTDDESYDAATGDAVQHTTAHHGNGGLLVWRKADNWTAFTDGAITWLNGPNGLQSRPNAGPLFPWESAPAANPPPDSSPVTADWAVHDDPDKTFRYPAGWRPHSQDGFNYYLGPNGVKVRYQAPFGMPGSVTIQDLLGRMYTAFTGDKGCDTGDVAQDTINGYPAGTIRFSCRILDARIGIRTVIKRGQWVHYVEVAAPPAFWTGNEATLRAILASYRPKKD